MNQRGGNGGRGGDRRSARLELQLSLPVAAPPPPTAIDGAAEAGGVSHDVDGGSGSSTPSSCVSSDGSPGSGCDGGGRSSSPMVIGACTRCLVYCMVARKDYPTCVSCKLPCLSDALFQHGHGGAGAGVVIDADDEKKRAKRK